MRDGRVRVRPPTGAAATVAVLPLARSAATTGSPTASSTRCWPRARSRGCRRCLRTSPRSARRCTARRGSHERGVGGGAARAAARRRCTARRRRAARPPAAGRRAGRQAAPRRLARGALQIGSFEPEYGFDERGELVGAERARDARPTPSSRSSCWPPTRRSPSSCCARHGRTLYRVHEPPEPASRRELLDVLEELGVPTPPFPGRERRPRGRRRGRAAAASAASSPRRAPARAAVASPCPAAAALAQAGALRRRRTSATSGSPARLPALHLADPPVPRPGRAPRLLRAARPGRRASSATPSWPPPPRTAPRWSARSPELELDADDVALSFLLERRLHDEGWEQVFTGEIVGARRRRPVRALRRLVRRLSSVPPPAAASASRSASTGRRSWARLRAGVSASAMRSASRVERVDRLSGKVDLAPAEACERTARADRAGGRAPRPAAELRQRQTQPAPAGPRRPAGAGADAAGVG